MAHKHLQIPDSFMKKIHKSTDKILNKKSSTGGKTIKVKASKRNGKIVKAHTRKTKGSTKKKVSPVVNTAFERSRLVNAGMSDVAKERYPTESSKKTPLKKGGMTAKQRRDKRLKKSASASKLKALKSGVKKPTGKSWSTRPYPKF